MPWIRALPFALLSFVSLAATADGFIEQASVASMGEIQSSQRVMQDSIADDTRNLARRLNQDHFALLQQLRALGAQLNLPVPDDAALAELAELATQASSRTPKGFSPDAAFAMAQIAAHEQAVKLFTQEAQSSDTPAVLKAFAEQHLPMLQRHLQMAQRLSKTHKK